MEMREIYHVNLLAGHHHRQVADGAMFLYNYAYTESKGRKIYMVSIAEIMRRMIVYSEGNRHDIQHFMKVWGYARLIGELEGLDDRTQFILETAAITHDIACPLCRKKYGCADGPLQEREGAVLVCDFLNGTGLSKAIIDRVSYLVAHHHTYEAVDGMDYQILLEADYLVNADESGYSDAQISAAYQRIFRTKHGAALLEEMYLKTDCANHRAAQPEE